MKSVAPERGSDPKSACTALRSTIVMDPSPFASPATRIAVGSEFVPFTGLNDVRSAERNPGAVATTLYVCPDRRPPMLKAPEEFVSVVAVPGNTDTLIPA